MRAKACKHCGREFNPATKYTYLCPECHAAAKASGVVQDRQCRQCGTTFRGGPRAWYCPSCRAEREHERSRNYRRDGFGRQLGSTDLCVRCGGEYTVTSGRQKYCPDCREQGVNEAVRQHKRQYAAERADQMAKYKADMTSNRHVCIICKAVFDSDQPRATCSDACDKIRRQRNQKRCDAKRTPRKRR